MSLRNVILAVAITSIASGCAARPRDIPATYVSPAKYDDYDCDRIRLERGQIQQALASASGAQYGARNRDVTFTGVGAVAFWPALFGLAASDYAEQVSVIKGEYDAISRTADQKNCELNVAYDTRTGRIVDEQQD